MPAVVYQGPLHNEEVVIDHLRRFNATGNTWDGGTTLDDGNRIDVFVDTPDPLLFKAAGYVIDWHQAGDIQCHVPVTLRQLKRGKPGIESMLTFDGRYWIKMVDGSEVKKGDRLYTPDADGINRDREVMSIAGGKLQTKTSGFCPDVIGTKFLIVDVEKVEDTAA